MTLAEVIRLWDDLKDGVRDGLPLWTPVAMRLLREAPEPLRILETFYDRFTPHRGSGSLANILNSRLPLLEQLAEDRNPLISDWAKEMKMQFMKRIDKIRQSEIKEARERDQRFEW